MVAHQPGSPMRAAPGFLESEYGGIALPAGTSAPESHRPRIHWRRQLAGLVVALITMYATSVALDFFPFLEEGGTLLVLYFFIIVSTALVGGTPPAIVAIILLTIITWQYDMPTWRIVRFVLMQLEGLTMVSVVELLRRATQKAKLEAERNRLGEQRYRLLFDENPQPMWVYDVETLRFLAVNAAAVRNYGYTHQEFMGMTILDIRDPKEEAAVKAAVRESIPLKEHHAGIWKHRRKDGSKFHTEVVSSAMEFGVRLARLVMATDVSARVQVEMERDRTHQSELIARREAEAANRAKDRFIAMLSHELRTPLTPILASVTSLLGSTHIDASVRKALEVVKRNVELESRLIEDLLDVSRIREDKLTLKLETVDLREVVKRAVEICRESAEQGNLELRLELQAVQNIARADPARIMQVVWNMLQNAIKYTPSGGTIEIRSSNQSNAKDPSGPPIWRLEIRDNGVGVEAGALERIFESFEQGAIARIRGPSGLGLGLSICKAIVVAHGGSIHAHSEGRDKGAVFTIELNVFALASEKQNQKRLEDEDADAPPKSSRILLVEDDDDTRGILAGLLYKIGHEVSSAPNAEEALKLAAIREFDLLLCDLSLPGISGAELMKTLKSKTNIKGVALTGWDGSLELGVVRSAGFRTILTKPIAFDDLKAAIERLLKAPPSS